MFHKKLHGNIADAETNPFLGNGTVFPATRPICGTGANPTANEPTI